MDILSLDALVVLISRRLKPLDRYGCLSQGIGKHLIEQTDKSMRALVK